MTYRPRRIHLSPRSKRAKGKKPRIVLTARPALEDWQEHKAKLSHEILMCDPPYRIAHNAALFVRTLFSVSWVIVCGLFAFTVQLIKILPDLAKFTLSIAWGAFLLFGVYVIYVAATSIQ